MPKPIVLDCPPHTPTLESREYVEFLVGCGLGLDEMVHVLQRTNWPMSLADLKRYYKDEIRHGVASCTVKVGKAMYDRAQAGDVKAATLWLRARAGWRDQAAAPIQPEEPGSKAELIDRILKTLTPEQALAVVQGVQTPAPAPATGTRH